MLTKQFLLSEFFLEPVFTVSSCVAENGRPLAELTAAPRVQQGVEFEMRLCPYEGSRKGKEMNISALPELSQGFQECVNDTTYLRLQYFEKNNIQEFNLYHFWRFTRAMSSMPAYMVRRANNALTDDSFPTRIGVLFKASQGLHLAAEVMILNGIDLNSQLSAQSIYEYIEEHNLFMDGERACAGPKNKVVEFIAAAWTGLHGDSRDNWLNDHIGDPSQLFTYSDAVSQLFMSKAVFEAKERLNSSALISKLSQNPNVNKLRCNYARFGIFAGKGEAFLRSFLRTTEHFYSPPSTQLSEINDDDVSLRDSLRDLFSHLPAEQAAICIDCVAQDLPTVKHWLHTAKQQQSTVAQALGYSVALPDIVITDIAGLGYLPFELSLAAGNIKLKSKNGAPLLISSTGQELSL